MLKLNQYPPFWFIIHRAFPDASLEKQIFAFYPHIYSSVDLSEDLLAHENTHLARQKSFVGACWWWFRYIISPKFRVKEEIRANKAQLLKAKEMLKSYHPPSRPWHELDRLTTQMARDLSSNVYGSCISYDEALRLLND